MELPQGTITFLFTDIEGSTPLWERHPEAMGTALARHDSLLQSAIKEHKGTIFKGTGDGFHAVFTRAEDGLACALAVQVALARAHWESEIGALRVRMALHTGTAELRENDYFGPSLNLVARLESLAHGGQILLSQATQNLVRDRLPTGVITLDLGQQQLKGLERPHRVYQLAAPDLPMDFPSLKTPFVERALPQQITPFIGREKELGEVNKLVGAADNRLVTIVGPGGIGKSRLAVETAAAVENDYQHGVYFVPLAPLESADGILPVLAKMIGLRFNVRGEPEEQLLDFLARKQMLLVMDNFEHVLDGAELVAKIVKNTKDVTILVTTQQRLMLSGETIYSLSGLGYPDGAAEGRSDDTSPMDYEAVNLLNRQGQLLRPSFKPDAEDIKHMIRICRLVQGMPLAIILAAGWLEILSFEEIADEIADSLDVLQSQVRDLPERQRSVRATFEYSWQHLPDGDRKSFMRLSVFRGGFNRKAARTIAGADIMTLRSLAEKSFIIALSQDRYDIHELLRNFAVEKLEETGTADDTRSLHGAYYSQAMQELEADIKGRRQALALNNIEIDLENLRAAWLFALNQNDFQKIDRSMESVYLFFNTRSRVKEGAALFEHARNQLDIGIQSTTWGRLLSRHAWLRSHYEIGQREIGQDISVSLSISRQENHLPEIAFAYLSLGHYQIQVMSDVEGALESFRQSHEYYEQLGDRFYLARALHRIGYCYSSIAGEYDSATEYFRRSLALSKESGNMSDATMSLAYVGSGYFIEGEFTKAEVHFREAIALAEEIDDKLIQAHVTILIGLIECLQGNLEQARLHAEFGLSIVRDTGFHNTIAYGLAVMGLRAAILGEFTQALRLTQESLATPSNGLGMMNGHWAQSLTYCGMDEIALARRHLSSAFEIVDQLRWPKKSSWLLPPAAIILAHDGWKARAVELLSLAMNHPLSSTGWIEQWSPIEELRLELENQLGREAYNSAWKRGQSLDLETEFSGLLVEISA